MCLFSEKDMFDATGVHITGKAPTKEELGASVLHKKYGSSLITTAEFSKEDYSDTRGSSALKRLFFTPKNKYEEHRMELADMFPMSVVVEAYEVPAGLNSTAMRNMAILLKDNYIVLPIRKKKDRDWKVFTGIKYGGAAKELLGRAIVIDLVVGGAIISDKLRDNTRFGNLIYSYELRNWVLGSKFEASVNKIEEVLS